MTKLSMQDVFETVARHLYTQGKPALDNSQCLYRGPDGTKCAVGCLIPDEVYVPQMDGGYRVRGLLSHWSQLWDLFDDTESREDWEEFLSCLQTVHDSNPSPTYPTFCTIKGGGPFYEPKLREDLTNVANNYDLDTSFMNELKMHHG